MNSFTKMISLSAVAALAACSTKSDTGADTSAVVAGDTSAMSSTTTTSSATTTTPTTGTTTGTTAGMGTTGGATASSTGAITKVNLNTATDAQILAIPGMGPRMLREFKEYRPYTSMEQFRREIGKYVDKAEVARLEQYVTIK
jgi:DNA uptake protein ComE-like DNA-binding protein